MPVRSRGRIRVKFKDTIRIREGIKIRLAKTPLR